MQIHAHVSTVKIALSNYYFYDEDGVQKERRKKNEGENKTDVDFCFFLRDAKIKVQQELRQGVGKINISIKGVLLQHSVQLFLQHKTYATSLNYRNKNLCHQKYLK